MIRAAMVTKCYGVECFSFGGTGAFPSKVTDGAAFFGIVLTKSDFRAGGVDFNCSAVVQPPTCFHQSRRLTSGY